MNLIDSHDIYENLGGKTKVTGRVVSINGKPFLAEDRSGWSGEEPHHHHHSDGWLQKIKEAIFADPPIQNQTILQYEIPPTATETFAYTTKEGRQGHFYLDAGRMFDSGRPMSAFDMWNARQQVQNGGILMDGAPLQKNEQLLWGSEAEALQRYMAHAAMSFDDIARAHDILYRDSHTPDAANRLAFKTFMTAPSKPQGLHIIIDSNNHGLFNEEAEEVGDLAMNQIARAISTAMGLAGLSSETGFHRIGGDEFHVFAPSLGDVRNFGSSLRNILEQQKSLTPHLHVSLGAGVGSSPSHAMEALTEAKQQKLKDVARLGGGKIMPPKRLYLFSSLGGNSGALDL